MNLKALALTVAFFLAAVPIQAAGAMDANGAYDWSGYYVGVHGGAAWVDGDIGPGSLTPPGTPGSDVDADGGLFGVLGGVNFQQDQFVFGIEGDLSFGDVDGKHAVFTLPSLEVDFIGTVRGRAGVAIDRFLLFGTAGIGVLSAKASERGGISNDSNTHIGLVIGAGAEYRFSDQLLFRAEYQHGFYDSKTYAFTPTPHTHKIDVDTDTVRGAVIWMF